LNIVKGTYEPTDVEAKCAFDEDEVWIIYFEIIKMNKFLFFFLLIYRMMKKPKRQQKLEKKPTNRRKKKV